ncbi:unnamed protein product [Effrenium voratum]|nr:unnamed protein product [Effrenium voratum]
MYTFGAPAVSKPPMPDLARDDKCFQGLRTYTENKLPGGGRQVDAASMFDAYPHPHISVLALDWAQDSYYQPCPGDATWPKGGGAADWGLHSETHYSPRLKEVTLDGVKMAEQEPFKTANDMVILAYKSYDSVENTIKERLDAQMMSEGAMGVCHARTKRAPLEDEAGDFVGKVQAELRRADWMHRPQPQPAELCNWGLYLGGLSEASDGKLMQDLNIRAIVNTASSMCIYTPRGALPPSDMRLLHIDADDCDYPILEKHYQEFEAFVTKAKADKCKTLVHCQAGMNRSSVLCAAYLMHAERFRLLEAIHLLVGRRGLVLTNRSFVKQLVHLACVEGLLD